MKKHQITFLPLLAAFAMAASLGCGPSDRSAGGSDDHGGGTTAAVTIDLAKIEGAFATATGVIKSEWDKIAASIKSADYSGALAKLQTLASNAGLTDDQKSALSDLIRQVKTKAGDFMKSATEAATKAADQAADAAKSLVPK